MMLLMRRLLRLLGLGNKSIMKNKKAELIIQMGVVSVIFSLLINPFTNNLQQTLCGGLILGLFFIAIIIRDK